VFLPRWCHVKAFLVLFAPVVLCCCLAAIPARADGILLGTPHLLVPGIGGDVNPGEAVAEGFYLTQTVALTGVNIGIFSDTESNPDLFLFQLTNRIGPGTTFGNILATFPVGGSDIPPDPFDFCGLAPGCVSPYLSLASSLMLQPGEYFVVGAEVHKPDLLGGAAWEGESSTLPSSVGGIGPAFFSSGLIDTTNPSNSTWSAFTDNRLLDFQLLGTVSKVPEPASAFLLVGGLGALYLAGLYNRQRNRHVNSPLDGS
jgi:hypothetical protein